MRSGSHSTRSKRKRPSGRDLGPRVQSRGAVSLQMLVLLVPVLLGLMGFAIDLGRMYLIRGEAKAAANAMALAAAQQLIGTEASIDAAATAARLTLNNTTGGANKFDFGGLLIGQTSGTLNSEAPDPTYFASMVEATAGDVGSGAGGSTARYARVQVTAESPLIFWSFLPIVSERKIATAAVAVAGVSAPLCTACAIEPIAVAPMDATETTDFGFITGTRYTLAYTCSGNPQPTGLQGAASVVPYLLLNRLDSEAAIFTDEQSQAFRIGAQGLPGSTTASKVCFTINTAEQIWANATPGQCSSAQPPGPVVSLLCGITTRFESSTPTACSQIAEVDTLASLYLPDTDTTDLDDYTQYLGNGRRVITVPIVDVLNTTGDMTLLGFRQFLVEPNQGGVDITPNDQYGRFVALYIGSVMPLRAGSFAGCTQTAGPGKVVLHQ